MDYILGRNALNHSYVTGWGERAAQNQHSRIYGHELDAGLPHPPAGSLAGGANAGIQDPYAGKLLAGCAPQFCYVDDIQSYATNEVAINWNSALSWVASFLADQGDGRVPAAAPVTVCDLLSFVEICTESSVFCIASSAACLASSAAFSSRSFARMAVSASTVMWCGCTSRNPPWTKTSSSCSWVGSFIRTEPGRICVSSGVCRG